MIPSQLLVSDLEKDGMTVRDFPGGKGRVGRGMYLTDRCELSGRREEGRARER